MTMHPDPEQSSGRGAISLTTLHMSGLPWLLLLGCLGFARLGWGGPDEPSGSSLAAAEEQAFVAAVDRVAASIVRVEAAGASVSGLRPGAEATPAIGPSTGVVVAAEGWIVASAFALPADVDTAIVTLSAMEQTAARRVAGRVIGRDKGRGIVLLKVDPGEALPVPAWAARDTLAVGQWVLAAGRGWASEQVSIAVGIVSATNRAWGRAVQTDAAVSPANYGGPLIDVEGRVIGILTPLPADTAGMQQGTELYDAGIGFAVPIEDLLRVLPRLQQGESLEPGLLGIGYRDRDAINGDPVIGFVRPGGPAAQVGLRTGDRIVSIGGQKVSRIADVRHGIMPLYDGDEVEMVVVRSGRGGDRQLTLHPRLTAELPPWKKGIVGMVVERQTASPERGRPADVARNEDRGGARAPSPLTVRWVWPETPADRMGVQAGDRVEAVLPGDRNAGSDPQPVATAAELGSILEGYLVGERPLLRIQRGDQTVDLAVELATPPVLIPEAVPPVEAALEPSDPASATRLVKLQAAEMGEPAWAVLPRQPTKSLGVLVYFDEPRGPLDEATAAAAAAAWAPASARFGVAVVFVGSTEPNRWTRADMANVVRSLSALRGEGDLDRERVAVVGRAAGGSFAWAVAAALGPAIRGVGMLDAAIPRQVGIDLAEPGRWRWVVLGGQRADEDAGLREKTALESAGHAVVRMPTLAGAAAQAEWWCRWVECLGLL